MLSALKADCSWPGWSQLIPHSRHHGLLKDFHLGEMDTHVGMTTRGEALKG